MKPMRAAGRAAEELVHGWEEMSTLNLAQLAQARDMAAKLVLAGGMDDANDLRARSLVVPHGPASDPKLRMPSSVSPGASSSEHLLRIITSCEGSCQMCAAMCVLACCCGQVCVPRVLQSAAYQSLGRSCV